MLNAEEVSLNEGLDAKDLIFAMAAIATPKASGNCNQHNRGKGRGNYNNRGGRGGRGAGNQSPQYNPFTPLFSQISPIQALVLLD